MWLLQIWLGVWLGAPSTHLRVLAGTAVLPSSNSGLLDWGLRKAELCFPSQTGFSKKKGHSSPSNGTLPRSGLGPPPWTGGLQRAGLCLPAWTRVCRAQAVPPCSDWGSWGKGGGWAGRGAVPDAPPAAEGPSPRRGIHLQAVLPLLLLLLLPAMLPPVHLHGLRAPGLPHTSRAVRQSHGCESKNLQSRGARLLHLVSTRPLPVASASISSEVCWWQGRGVSLYGGQAGDLKTQQGAWLAHHPMGCPTLRSRPWLPAALCPCPSTWSEQGLPFSGLSFPHVRD